MYFNYTKHIPKPPIKNSRLRLWAHSEFEEEHYPIDDKVRVVQVRTYTTSKLSLFFKETINTTQLGA